MGRERGGHGRRNRGSRAPGTSTARLRAVRTPPEPPAALAAWAGVNSEPTMRIGEIGARLGLSHRTIRHYEDTGLVIPSARTPGGFRLYSARDFQKFLIIMSMRPLDFPLEDVSRFLAAIDDALADDDGRRQLALQVFTEFTAAVEERLAALRQKVEIAAGFRTFLSRDVLTGYDPSTS